METRLKLTSTRNQLNSKGFRPCKKEACLVGLKRAFINHHAGNLTCEYVRRGCRGAPKTPSPPVHFRLYMRFRKTENASVDFCPHYRFRSVFGCPPRTLEYDDRIDVKRLCLRCKAIMPLYSCKQTIIFARSMRNVAS